MTSLEESLRAYDGKSTAVLESILGAGAPDAAELREAVALCGSAEPHVAAGASWLLRAWAEAEGVSVGAPLVRRLAVVLPQIEDHWARQHVCQALRSLRVPRPVAEEFAAFVRACVASERPFLRAWAVDGMVRLSAAHSDYRLEAEGMVAAALGDPKASVRARARHLAAELAAS